MSFLFYSSSIEDVQSLLLPRPKSATNSEKSAELWDAGDYYVNVFNLKVERAARSLKILDPSTTNSTHLVLLEGDSSISSIYRLGIGVKYVC